MELLHRSPAPTCRVLIGLGVLLAAIPSLPAQEGPFLRGDVNGDGFVSIADVTMLRRYMYFRNDGYVPSCLDSGDVDDSGRLNITDAVELMHHLVISPLGVSHIGGSYPEEEFDATADALTCESYSVQPPEQTPDLVRLGTVEAAPGAEVEVPIFITSVVPIEAFQLVVRYDPDLFTPTPPKLEIAGTALEGMPGTPTEGMAGEHFNWVNEALDEGLLAIGVIGSFRKDDFDIPAGVDVVAGKLKGTLSSSLPPGAVVRLDPDNGPSGAGFGFKKLRNELVHEGVARLVTVLPRLEGMAFRIVSDITFFRADSNSDGQVQVSDVVFTVSHLFLAGAPPSCPDAADADDSGRIDLTDIVLTISHLFLGTGTPAPPHPLRGRDYEPDALGPCRAGNS